MNEEYQPSRWSTVLLLLAFALIAAGLCYLALCAAGSM